MTRRTRAALALSTPLLALSGRCQTFAARAHGHEPIRAALASAWDCSDYPPNPSPTPRAHSSLSWVAEQCDATYGCVASTGTVGRRAAAMRLAVPHLSPALATPSTSRPLWRHAGCALAACAQRTCSTPQRSPRRLTAVLGGACSPRGRRLGGGGGAGWAVLAPPEGGGGGAGWAVLAPPEGGGLHASAQHGASHTYTATRRTTWRRCGWRRPWTARTRYALRTALMRAEDGEAS